MNPRKAKSETTEASKAAQDALAKLGNGLSHLVREGAVSDVNELVNGLASALDIPADAFALVLRRTQERHDAQKLAMGRELRAGAEEAGCDIAYRPPYVSFGCVTFHEEKPDEWKLSILDGLALETVRGASGHALAVRARARIAELEAALNTFNEFRQVIDIVREAFGGAATVSVPANVLMVLCAHGIALRKHLTASGIIKSEAGLSRAQFGYLLARLQKECGGELKMKLSGATQHDTKAPQRYIAVPDNYDPRKVTGDRRVTAVVFGE